MCIGASSESSYCANMWRLSYYTIISHYSVQRDIFCFWRVENRKFLFEAPCSAQWFHEKPTYQASSPLQAAVSCGKMLNSVRVRFYQCQCWLSWLFTELTFEGSRHLAESFRTTIVCFGIYTYSVVSSFKFMAFILLIKQIILLLSHSKRVAFFGILMIIPFSTPWKRTGFQNLRIIGTSKPTETAQTAGNSSAGRPTNPVVLPFLDALMTEMVSFLFEGAVFIDGLLYHPR